MSTDQTPDVPVDVIIAAYSDEQGASGALKELDKAKKDGIITIKDAAVLKRDPNNKLHITESADKGFGRGAMIGGVAGAAVGVLAGPVGWAALGGAAVGGLAAKLRDGGFPDDRLREVGESVQPGNSALVAVVEEVWVKDAQRILEENAANIVTNAVSADIAAQLDADAARSQQDSGPA
jgi:uncharacterized membrane protein